CARIRSLDSYFDYW
nr:immunoglobulin heavy chain junction region [Mus musculus]MBK4196097.1 immunoglobulin heavy chain junction region [Mus musculus]MBK4196098.1 immunoglobulin heavy chain junction region [Mus musculus]